MSAVADLFAPWCAEAKVGFATSVPDGYLVPLIAAVRESGIPHVAAAREEECLGMAAGAVMTGRRALVMVQNSGFLNSIGCFATLCMNYRLPMVVLVSHRGNIFDRNKYDTEKHRFFEAFMRNTHVFCASWYAHRADGNMVKRAFECAESRAEPVVLSLDFPPAREAAC